MKTEARTECQVIATKIKTLITMHSLCHLCVNTTSPCDMLGNTTTNLLTIRKNFLNQFVTN